MLHEAGCGEMSAEDNLTKGRTYRAVPTFCHTRPGRSAWRSSGWGSCSGWAREYGPACQRQCEGSSSSAHPHPSWWPDRQKTQLPWQWACTWRSARTLYWSGKPALVCGTWLTRKPGRDEQRSDALVCIYFQRQYWRLCKLRGCKCAIKAFNCLFPVKQACPPFPI